MDKSASTDSDEGNQMVDVIKDEPIRGTPPSLYENHYQPSPIDINLDPRKIQQMQMLEHRFSSPKLPTSRDSYFKEGNNGTDIRDVYVDDEAIKNNNNSSDEKDSTKDTSPLSTSLDGGKKEKKRRKNYTQEEDDKIKEGLRNTGMTGTKLLNGQK